MRSKNVEPSISGIGIEEAYIIEMKFANKAETEITGNTGLLIILAKEIQSDSVTS